MDWTTLISVVIGGLIATIPILINNRFQSREREREREETRKEAKVQLTMELMRNDIKVLEDAINNYLSGIAELRRIRVQHSETGDRVAEVRSKIVEKDEFYKLIHVNIIADKIAYGLGQEIYSEYKGCMELFREQLGLILAVPIQTEKEEQWILSIVSRTGKLHTMLAEKLISIRDT
jgi:hypothetical protein